MKKKLIMLCTTLIALVLEILPYGAVCNFALDEGESLRQTFSYFDLTPFGYANFAPFIVALLTCALTVMIVVSLVSNKPIRTPILTVSVIATVLSLAPLLYGVIVGVAIIAGAVIQALGNIAASGLVIGVGVLIGLALILYAQFKYNKGLF